MLVRLSPHMSYPRKQMKEMLENYIQLRLRTREKYSNNISDECVLRVQTDEGQKHFTATETSYCHRRLRSQTPRVFRLDLHHSVNAM